MTTRDHEGRLNKALAAGKAWPSAEQIQMMKPDDCSAVRAPITFFARNNSHYPAHIDRDEAGPARQRRPARCTSSARPPFASVLAEARRIGLLAIGKMERISFHAPPALVMAAKQETGVSAIDELGTLALVMLMRPDPVAAFSTVLRDVSGQSMTSMPDLQWMRRRISAAHLYGRQDKSVVGEMLSPHRQGQDVSGLLLWACAATDGPDKSGHDDRGTASPCHGRPPRAGP